MVDVENHSAKISFLIPDQDVGLQKPTTCDKQGGGGPSSGKNDGGAQPVGDPRRGLDADTEGKL